MFRRKQKDSDERIAPERIAYTKYYEQDGMLRAYANRSMVLAMLFGAIALTAVVFAMYVRMQPPTVIRVDSKGEATVISGAATRPATSLAGLLAASAHAPELAPSDIEGRAVVRRFLVAYLTYTPTSVDRQLADALNM